MSRVLVAIDGSEAAAAAAARAAALLGPDHDYLVVEAVHVPMPVATAAVGISPGYAAGVGSSPELLRSAGERALAEGRADAAGAIRRMKVKARPVVETGAPIDVIREAVTSRHVDLLVIGSHGKGLAERVFTGSVSHQILKDPPCPVLVVPVGG